MWLYFRKSPFPKHFDSTLGWLVTISLIYSTAAGQQVPLSPEERLLFESTLGLDWLDTDAADSIMQVDMWKQQSEPIPAEVSAQVWLKPAYVLKSLCAMQTFFYFSLEEPLSSPFQGIEYWKAESADDCIIASPSDAPQGVTVSEKIPTDSIVRIIRAQEQLLQRAFAEHGDLAAMPFDPSKDWHLRSISLSEFGPNGISYSATFSREQGQSGPVVSFSMTDSSFVIFGLGYWIV